MIGVLVTRPFLAVVPRFLALVDRWGRCVIIAKCSRIEIGSEVAGEVGQFLDGAEEFGGGRLRLEGFHLVEEALTEGGFIEEIEIGAFRVGVRYDHVGLDDLAVYELDACGFAYIVGAAVCQDALDLGAGPD